MRGGRYTRGGWIYERRVDIREEGRYMRRARYTRGGWIYERGEGTREGVDI